VAAYIVAHVDVEDWDAYREYMRHTPRVIQKFGGRFIARGGEMVTLEGPEETLRVVLIEFPYLEKAKAFYNSADYAQTKKLRERVERRSSWLLMATQSRNGTKRSKRVASSHFRSEKRCRLTRSRRTAR
jgi:uncharacterized protein (DUF1330 family)